MDVSSKERVSATTVLVALQDVDEPTAVQQQTRDHLQRNLAVQDPDTLDELVDELDVDGLKDYHVLKIIETLPMSADEVTTLFSKERIRIDDDDIETITSFAASIGRE